MATATKSGMKDLKSVNKELQKKLKLMEAEVKALTENARETRKDCSSLSKYEIKPNGEYTRHTKLLDRTLQTSLAKYKIPVNIQIAAVAHANKTVQRMMETGQFDEDDTRIWPNQIETLAEVIAKVIKEPHKSMVLIGSTQLGKTMLLICISIVEHILTIVQETPYQTVIIGPGKIALDQQTRDDYHFVKSNYNFIVNGEAYNDFRTNLKNIILSSAAEKYDTPVYRRTNGKSTLKEMREIAENAHLNGVRVIFIVDECHWGSHQEGVLQKIISYAKELTTNKEGDMMIAISATPFQLGNLSGLNRVYCRTYEGYVGYAFWEGELLDSRYKPIYPKPFSFDEIYVEFGVKDFEHVNRKRYLKPKSFEKAKRAIEKKTCALTPFAKVWRNKTHNQYKEFCELKLIELIKACLIDKNEIGGRGFIARFFLRNDEAKEFLERRNKDFLKLGIKAISWQGEEAKHSLAQHLRNNGIQTEDLKAVFVTGSGRMGNRIQDSDKIYYGIDLAENSNLTAVLQGLLGRMTGAKSEAPIVFFEKKVVEQLRLYVKSKGKMFMKKPNSRTVLAENTRHGHDIRIGIDSSDDGRISFDSLGLSEIGNWLKEWTKNNIKVERLANRHCLSPEASIQLMKYLFTGKRISDIEKALHLEENTLLRYGGDLTDKQLLRKGPPYVDRQGLAYSNRVGLRTVYEKMLKGNSTRMEAQDRTRSGTKTGIRINAPQLHIMMTKQRKQIVWIPIGLKIRCCDKTSYGKSLVYTSENDIAFQFATDLEIETILESKGK